MPHFFQLSLRNLRIQFPFIYSCKVSSLFPVYFTLGKRLSICASCLSQTSVTGIYLVFHFSNEKTFRLHLYTRSPARSFSPWIFYSKNTISSSAECSFWTKFGSICICVVCLSFRISSLLTLPRCPSFSFAASFTGSPNQIVLLLPMKQIIKSSFQLTASAEVLHPFHFFAVSQT